MAKRGGRSGRRYVRDSIGRFASKGYSGQTSGRGARLKAKGKKRAEGGATVKPKRIGETKNTISKSSSKRKVNASSRASDRQIARDVAARSKPTAARTSKAPTNNARATGKLARPVAKGNIRRTNARLGPNNNIKPGPKSPRTKMNRAIDNVIKKGKALKGSAEKLRGVKKQADALRGRMLKEDKGRLGKALSKPSVTDKRSRDYGGRLTKGARGQDPATGGKKSRAKRGDTAEANIPMKGRRGKQLDASISKAAKQVKAAETARLIKPKAQRKSERAAKAEAKRQTAAAKPKRVRSAESLRVSRAKRITKERSISLNPAGNTQKGAGRMAANAKRTQERALAFYKGKPKPAAAKPTAAKRRGAVGKISEAKAGRIVARMDAQRGRKALPGRRNANFARTAERRSQFILKPAATARNKGKRISVNESVQKAVANAAKRRKPKRRRS